MTKAQAIHLAKAGGYTRILTVNGPVRLEDWSPYGGLGNNHQFYVDRGLIREIPDALDIKLGLLLGVWTLLP